MALGFVDVWAAAGGGSLRIIDRYLARAVTGGTLIALLVLGALDVFFAFINEMGETGSNEYQWIEAAVHVGLTVPRRLYELFPMSVLLGGLLSLGALAGNGELVAIRSAGVPIAGIIRSVLKSGLVLMLGAIVIGELVAPVTEQRAQNMRAAAHSDRIALKSQDGLWARDGNRFLNIEVVLPDMRLRGIRVFVFDRDLRLTQSIYAASAQLDGDSWLMQDLRYSVIGEEGVSTEQRAQERWKRLISPRLLNVIVVKPEQMSAWTLSQYVAYLKANSLDARRYELAFWVRFTTPLSSLVMLLLAVPFVFGSLRSGSAGSRLFVGILIGIGFYIINRMVSHLGLVYGLSPFLSATLPLFAFLAYSLLALRRIP